MLEAQPKDKKRGMVKTPNIAATAGVMYSQFESVSLTFNLQTCLE
jgi:hypothetical protein